MQSFSFCSSSSSSSDDDDDDDDEELSKFFNSFSKIVSSLLREYPLADSLSSIADNRVSIDDIFIII